MQKLQEEYVRLSNDFEDKINKSPKSLKKIWAYLVSEIRTGYIMDEMWDEKNDSLKFRRGGKTLVSIALNLENINILIIFGKAEREKFEENPAAFSEHIQNIYYSSKTYHDGKWMSIDISDMKAAKEIIQLIHIKKKPNRKPLPDDKIACCGQSCTNCLLYEKKIEKKDQREEVTLGFAKCYGDSGEYPQTICGGCLSDKQIVGNCNITVCAKEKGISKCKNCSELRCKTKNEWGVNAGLCTPGLSAEDVTKFVMPYVNKKMLRKY